MINRTLQLYRNSYSNLSIEVWILALVMFINRAGAMVIPFLTIIMTEGRGFSLKEAGFMMSSFGLGSIIGSWMGGKLTDKIGNYPIMFWSLIFTGVMFFVILPLNNLIALCVAFFFLSSVSDMFRPANQAALTLYSKKENLTRSFGLVRLAVNLGFAMGPALAGVLVAAVGYNSVFYIDGISCIIAAIILRSFLKPKKRVVGTEVVKEEVIEEKEVVAPLKDKFYLRFLLFNFLQALAFMQFITAIPAYFKQDLFLTEKQIGLVLAVNGLLIALTEMPLVYSIENKGSKLYYLMLGAMFYVIAYVSLLMSTPALAAALIFILFLTVGEMLYMPFAGSFVGSRAPKSILGRYMGIFSMSWGLATIIGPTGGLYLAETFGFQYLWILAAALAVIASVGLNVLKRQLAMKKG